MALITSIRKHFWFVLILLGLALASFIIMDVAKSSNGGGRGTLTLGEVGGQSISYNDFQKTENIYYKNSSEDSYSKRSRIWDYFVEKTIVETEAEELGLAVSEDEVEELEFGTNLSPIIEANWRNQQTQQVDRAKLADFKSAIDAGQQLNPTFRDFWLEQRNQVKKSQLQTKLSNIVSKAIYTPKWMSDQISKLGKDQVKIAYVKIPKAKITTSVELTDEDYQAYLNDNKYKYELNEPNRVLDIAEFPVRATKADSTKLFDRLMEDKLLFQKDPADSLFAVNHNGSYANFYFESDKLPASIKAAVLSMENGDAYGPYIENGAYNAVKLIEKRIIADSVHASHILRSVDASVPGQLQDAQKYIDSIRSMINNGADFAEIAKTSSQDPGSGAKGGDLGYFGQGAMVPSFNAACFYDESKGLKVVRSRFGIHLIKVHDKKFVNRVPKYKLGFIRSLIIPSQYTQDKMYEEISNLLTTNTDFESLKTAVEGLKGSFVTAPPIVKNDFNVGTLGAGQTSRDIVRWAFEIDGTPGTICPEVFTYTDKVNYYNNKYVLAVLKQANEAGMPSVASMKSVIKSDVEAYKKSQALVSSVGTDLSQIAAKYGVKVDTASNVSFTASYVPGIGTEPKVISKAFGLNVGDSPIAVAGNGGVFVLSVVDKTEGAEVSSLPQFRNNDRDNKRRTVASTLIKALKKNLKVDDNRSTFF